jgi:hypothetical protein
VKRRVIGTLIAVVVAFLMGGAAAHAQSINAEIGFPFSAGGQELTAGKFNIEVASGGAASGLITLRGQDGRPIMLKVITTLGRHDKDPDAELVFDKIGGKMLLSEIWMPGKDGMLILATAVPHEHAVLGGSNPRK